MEIFSPFHTEPYILIVKGLMLLLSKQSVIQDQRLIKWASKKGT